MVVVKILDRDGMVYLRKLIHYKREHSGDRIVIMTYYKENRSDRIPEKLYFCLNNNECNILYNTMKQEAGVAF